jgi:hypothetical protein
MPALTVRYHTLVHSMRNRDIFQKEKQRLYLGFDGLQYGFLTFSGHFGIRS